MALACEYCKDSCNPVSTLVCLLFTFFCGPAYSSVEKGLQIVLARRLKIDLDFRKMRQK